VRFHSPQDAVDRSIAVVHQDYHVWPDLTVAENIIGTLRRPPQFASFVRSRTMRREAHDLLERLGIDLDVERKVRDLDAAEKKFVEIARALAVDAAFLILDEPTASLESRESDRLLALLERLRAADHGIILVTHRLEEVVRVADRATILRDGRNAGFISRDVMTATCSSKRSSAAYPKNRSRPAPAARRPSSPSPRCARGPKQRRSI